MTALQLPPNTRIGWAPNHTKQAAALCCPVFELLMHGSRGGGKALDVSQRVLTDGGWKAAADVTLADRLVAHDGTYTRIMGIYPQPPKPYYRVTTRGGASVVVCGEHLWRVKDGKNGYWHVWTTDQIRRSKTPQYLPLMSKPAPGVRWNGPDPYIAGYILGNGCLTGAHVVCYTVEPFVIDYLKAAGWRDYDYASQNTHMVTETRGEQKRAWRDLLGRCKGDQKRIPEALLHADPETRLALLQGLMDSDGSVERGRGTQANPGGQCSFTSVSRHLAEGVQYLVRSLGGKARIRWKNKVSDRGGRDGYWCVSVTHAGKFQPFRLPRKAELIKPHQNGDSDSIESIEPVGNRDGVCFAVEHPDRLFVCQDFIVTHNTDVLLMDFAQHVGQGFGAAWRGVIFRRQFKDLLTDLIPKSIKWFKQLFPDAQFIGGNTPEWRFATGEVLMFRHLKDKEGYWDYHGSEIPFIGFEELCTWPDPSAYEIMFSVCRSSRRGMPRKIRATTNPYGPGHNWVKRRFKLDAGGGLGQGVIIKDKDGRERTHLQLLMEDNPALMDADPEYVQSIKGIRDPNIRKAWLKGRWDIVAGGMFDDLWTPDVHIVNAFPIPSSWRIDRSYDHGSAKPFAVQWWAESDGTGGGAVPIVPPKTLFLIAQWYGSNGQPNEGCRLPDTAIAKGIVKREEDMGIRGRVKAGPADSQIFTKDPNTNDSIAAAMERCGVRWTPADKSPGSRVRGVEMFRRRLAASLAKPMEEPGFFAFDGCEDFIRTVPTLPRSEKDPEDVDTEAEDHDWDACRYRIASTHKPAKTSYVVMG